MFDIFFIPLFLVLIYGTVAFLTGMKMGKENMPKSILEWLVVTLGKWFGPLLMVTSSSCILSLAVGRFTGALKRAEMKEYQRKVLLKSYEEFSIYGKVDSLNGREVLSLFMTDSKVDTLLMDRISAEHQVSIQAIIDQQ
ncbi:hypothetical protein [Chitinophaga sp. CF418]|uniref:hypothetical protein n=1 Tax=Chitinophaga sp. CF418 TaxID=1855287 RepID=UPI0009174AD3|nr:hypothetical protein [Chitinophaga sp. CF418]SHN45550.1 hypothetical protein SAMN05216311_120103 [Chitinophaga sp. CF418]